MVGYAQFPFSAGCAPRPLRPSLAAAPGGLCFAPAKRKTGKRENARRMPSTPGLSRAAALSAPFRCAPLRYTLDSPSVPGGWGGVFSLFSGFSLFWGVPRWAWRGAWRVSSGFGGVSWFLRLVLSLSVVPALWSFPARGWGVSPCRPRGGGGWSGLPSVPVPVAGGFALRGALSRVPWWWWALVLRLPLRPSRFRFRGGAGCRWRCAGSVAVPVRCSGFRSRWPFRRAWPWPRPPGCRRAAPGCAASGRGRGRRRGVAGAAACGPRPGPAGGPRLGGVRALARGRLRLRGRCRGAWGGARVGCVGVRGVRAGRGWLVPGVRRVGGGGGRRRWRVGRLVGGWPGLCPARGPACGPFFRRGRRGLVRLRGVFRLALLAGFVARGLSRGWPVLAGCGVPGWVSRFRVAFAGCGFLGAVFAGWRVGFGLVLGSGPGGAVLVAGSGCPRQSAAGARSDRRFPLHPPAPRPFFELFEEVSMFIFRVLLVVSIVLLWAAISLDPPTTTAEFIREYCPDAHTDTELQRCTGAVF